MSFAKNMPRIFTLSLLLACAACTQEHKSGEYVQITNIAPPIAQPLRVGQSVEVAIDFTYQLDAPSGAVDIIAQTADQTPISRTFKIISKGQGSAKLAMRFVVPKTTGIEVFSSLTKDGDKQTSIVDTRYMKVEQ
jgi:hypothetical protein